MELNDIEILGNKGIERISTHAVKLSWYNMQLKIIIWKPLIRKDEAPKLYHVLVDITVAIYLVIVSSIFESVSGIHICWFIGTSSSDITETNEIIN